MVKVSLEHVSKTFANVKALDDVSVEIREGELFLMLGPSGCGKTTALRTIAGFYKPSSGTVRFDNDDVTNVPPYKRNTGMVFQNYALWPHMNVYDNVAFGLKMRKVATSERVERVKHMLDVVKMREYADRFPNQLSGGQQQRIALARALVIEPSVFLLDEPLSNLDAKLRLEMRFELRRIQKDLGITAIYVTHDQTEALAIADRIAVMSVGRIAQVGSPREIYQYPRSKFVADFIGEPNILDGRIESISKENGLARVKVDERLTVEGRLPSDFSSYAIGDSVSCFIRPESILGNEQSKQSFEVKVGETSYQGQMELYELKLPDGKVLRAIAFNPIEGLQSGQSLKIQLPAESVLVLKE